MKKVIEKDYELIKVICDYDKKQFIIYIEDDELFPFLEELKQKKVEIFSYAYLNGEGELREGVRIIVKE